MDSRSEFPTIARGSKTLPPSDWIAQSCADVPHTQEKWKFKVNLVDPVVPIFPNLLATTVLRCQRKQEPHHPSQASDQQAICQVETRNYRNALSRERGDMHRIPQIRAAQLWYRPWNLLSHKVLYLVCAIDSGEQFICWGLRAIIKDGLIDWLIDWLICLLYTSPSPRD